MRVQSYVKLTSQLAGDMQAAQQQLATMRREGTPVSLEWNRKFDDFALRLDQARQGYLQLFPSSDRTANVLRDDTFHTSARAGCLKYLAKHDLALPKGNDWASPLQSTIDDLTRAGDLASSRA
jgi:hypothetical protein